VPKCKYFDPRTNDQLFPYLTTFDFYSDSIQGQGQDFNRPRLVVSVGDAKLCRSVSRWPATAAVTNETKPDAELWENGNSPTRSR